MLVQHPEKLRVQQRHLLEVQAALLARGFYIFTGDNMGVEVSLLSSGWPGISSESCRCLFLTS